MVKQVIRIFQNKIAIIQFVFLSISGQGFAQSKPLFVPDQIDNSRQLHLDCYCNPGVSNQSRSRGVELMYQYQDTRIYEDVQEVPSTEPQAAVNSSALFEFNLKIPIINHEQRKFLIGYKYSQELYKLSSFGQDFTALFREFNKATFKHSVLSVLYTESLNEYNYFAFRGRFLHNGNYSGIVDFDSRYGFFDLVGFWGNKKTEDFEWGLGLSYGRNIESEGRVIPFVMLNKNFSEKWGIESVLPAYLLFRYNINQGAMLFGGVEVESQNFAFNLETNNSSTVPYYIFDYSRILLSTSIEKKIVDWVWFDIKVGYAFPFNTEFTSDSLPSFEVDPSNHFLFKIGLFVSPPDEFIK